MPAEIGGGGRHDDEVTDPDGDLLLAARAHVPLPSLEGVHPPHLGSLVRSARLHPSILVDPSWSPGASPRPTSLAHLAVPPPS